jgi:hypothetical protein
MTSPALGALLWPTYLHLLVLGWLTQLIFGVAFWMFPRYSARNPTVVSGLAGRVTGSSMPDYSSGL